MAFTPEIKNFTKNTLILTLIFSVVIHLSWGTISSWMGLGASASYNDTHFERSDVTYVGNIATALSLNLGGSTQNTTSIFHPDIISITEVMQNPTVGQEKLIASNMVSLTAYLQVLRMNVSELLNTDSNRAGALDRHISLLQSHEIRANERLALIRDQKNDLRAMIEQANAEEKAAKSILEGSYQSMVYTGVDQAIERLLRAKNTSLRARIYMVYLDRFERSYRLLQEKNTQLLQVLTSNRTAIIQRQTIVIPNEGSEILKELGLIESEAEYRAREILQTSP